MYTLLILSAAFQIVPVMKCDDFFGRYCSYPLFLAERGHLDGDYCTVKFPMFSKDTVAATEICEENSPFVVKQAISGDLHTTCKYERPPIKCGDDEVSLFDVCLSLGDFGNYTQADEKCGEGRSLYVITNENDWVWTAAVFDGSAKYMWVGVDEEFEKQRQPIKEKKKGRRKKRAANDDGYGVEDVAKPVKMQNSISTQYSRGTLFVAEKGERHRFLCMGSGVYYQRGIESLIDDAKAIGLDVFEAKDRFGSKRPFVVFNSVFAVHLKSRFDVSYTDFQDLCNVFPNGYVASRFDFYDDDEFRKAMSNSKMKRLRIKVLRDKSMDVEPSSSCNEDAEQHKIFRKKFVFINENGTRSAIPPEHWDSAYPMNMCADTPRVTAVMTPGGYQDYPAISRFPVLCTFGNPPTLPLADNKDLCNSAAHYDTATERCVCNDLSSDVKVKYPDKFKELPYGTICETCSLTEHSRAFVFVLDQSFSVEDHSWSHVQNFLRIAAKFVADAHSSVIAFDHTVQVVLPMGRYNEAEFADKATRRVLDGSTSISPAMGAADRELQRAPADSAKVVLLLSDGDGSCGDGGYTCSGLAILPTFSVKYQPQKHFGGFGVDEFEAVMEWRREGTTLVFIPIAYTNDRLEADIGRQPPHKILPVNNFDGLDEKFFAKIIREICVQAK
ncbi:hypothetical protein Q1695_005286 [Nippostrongylus brasiliensis]|nr:hypothetical protein Q1695_005286 [Nippostrongylus brasiliensis]